MKLKIQQKSIFFILLNENASSAYLLRRKTEDNNCQVKDMNVLKEYNDNSSKRMK